jgi:hypothetical protein
MYEDIGLRLCGPPRIDLGYPVCKKLKMRFEDSGLIWDQRIVLKPVQPRMRMGKCSQQRSSTNPLPESWMVCIRFRSKRASDLFWEQTTVSKDNNCSS